MRAGTDIHLGIGQRLALFSGQQALELVDPGGDGLAYGGDLRLPVGDGRVLPPWERLACCSHRAVKLSAGRVGRAANDLFGCWVHDVEIRLARHADPVD